MNRTKIKGGCQSGRKVVTHNSKSDVPLNFFETRDIIGCGRNIAYLLERWYSMYLENFIILVNRCAVNGRFHQGQRLHVLASPPIGCIIHCCVNNVQRCETTLKMFFFNKYTINLLILEFKSSLSFFKFINPFQTFYFWPRNAMYLK